MGCDIHVFHEQFINNRWEYIEEIDLLRNYVLFTVLANVRSGEDRVKIISTPKGLPNDLSDEVRAEVQSWNGDGHSYSWLTKQEFFDFNWECDIFLNGFVDEQEYKVYLETGSPSGWCKGVEGQKTKIISEEEMKNMTKEKEISYYCHIILNSLIIITDGENSGGPDPMSVIEAVYSNHNSASTQDYQVMTSTQLLSFVGFDISESKFGKYHQMGARVTSASNQEELERSLRALLEADITKLEGN